MVLGYTLQINQVRHTSTRIVVCLRLFYHKLVIVIRCNTELIGPDDDDDKIVDETHSPKYFIEGNQVLFGRTRTLFFDVSQNFTGHKLFMK